MYFSWLGGLAIKIKTWMNHHHFIHGASHKLAAPVSLCLSSTPKYPPSSGCFSHWSHQKTSFNRVGIFTEFTLAFKKKKSWLHPVGLLMRAACSLILLSISKSWFFRNPFHSFDAEAKILGLFLLCKHWYLVLRWLEVSGCALQWKESQASTSVKMYFGSCCLMPPYRMQKNRSLFFCYCLKPDKFFDGALSCSPGNYSCCHWNTVL